MIRVLLVDDHPSFRQPLAFLLNREPDLEVVGQAGTLAVARGMLGGVDVAVIDVDLPDGVGVDLVGELRAASPRAMALILTASVGPREMARAIEAGAAAVMYKSASIEDLLDAVRRLGKGEHLISPREIIDVLRQADRQREQDREAQTALAQLTARERDVLQALSGGLADKEIAQSLGVRTETVRTHMTNILGKLGVESRLQALVFAVRHGAVKIQ